MKPVSPSRLAAFVPGRRSRASRATVAVLCAVVFGALAAAAWSGALRRVKTLVHRTHSDLGGVRGAAVQRLVDAGGDAGKGRMLLAITTCSGWANVARLLRLSTLPQSLVDVAIVDDWSMPPDLAAFPELAGVRVIRAHQPRGLTYSWNLAWRAFVVEEQYDTLVITNDDVVIPRGSLEALHSALMSPEAIAGGFYCLGPTTTPRGLGGAGIANGGYHRWQSVHWLYPRLNESLRAEDPGIDNAQAVQDAILAAGADDAGAGAEGNASAPRTVPPPLLPITADVKNPEYMSLLLGFMLGFSRGAILHQDSGDNLVAPTIVNLGGERDIRGRVRMAVATRSFVWHSKGGTLAANTDRNSMHGCPRPSWSPASTLTPRPRPLSSYYAR